MGFVYIPVELVQNIMKRINSNALRTFMSLQAVSRSLRFPILFAIYLNVYKYICYSVGYMLSVCAGCVLFSFFISISLSCAREYMMHKKKVCVSLIFMRQCIPLAGYVSAQASVIYTVNV